jgi:type IV pilus assembly protein PilA
MKSDLQVKFLSFMTGRKKGEGFTLIELLVVIIIIGILAAIALPSFLNQANKAKQSEAKQYVGAVVRAQQAYQLENATFADDFAKLAKVVREKTVNYEYKIAGASDTAVTIHGESQKEALRAYAGGVSIYSVTTAGTNKESTTSAIVCQADEAKKGATSAPTSAAGVLSCAANTTAVEK